MCTLWQNTRTQDNKTNIQTFATFFSCEWGVIRHQAAVWGKDGDKRGVTKWEGKRAATEGATDRETEKEETRRGELGHWCCFFLVCSYVGHFFPSMRERGICKSDITRHLARSDASDDALSVLAILLYRFTAGNTAPHLVVSWLKVEQWEDGEISDGRRRVKKKRRIYQWKLELQNRYLQRHRFLDGCRTSGVTPRKFSASCLHPFTYFLNHL